MPPMGAPPGARFDPVGPGLGPFPGGSGRGRGIGRGMPGRGNMGDPDFDDFPPPGVSDHLAFCAAEAHLTSLAWLRRHVYVSRLRVVGGISFWVMLESIIL